VSTFTPDHLASILRRLLPIGVTRVAVAFSGGLDSTVLLTALARVRAANGLDLRALHVNHGLQAAASSWAEHCRRVAAALHVPFEQLVVKVRALELGVEAAARRARYDALAQALSDNEALLTAHHADDQLETMLLALARGAGVRGLSAMPAVQPFACGLLVRPLLDFTRSDLERWARAEGLGWVEDPMNELITLDRSFLRREIVARLRARFPSIARTAARSARHLQEASELLDDLAQLDLDTVRVEAALDVERLRSLSAARRRNVLRRWLRDFGVRAPSSARLAGIDHDMLAAKHDRMPCTEVDGVQVRRHRRLLYCVPRLPPVPSEPIEWRTNAELPLPGGLGALELVPEMGVGLSAVRLPRQLHVMFRRGGEMLKAAGEKHRRSLKKRLQEANVLPWWRGRLPLIYANGRLVAVGDLWIDADFAARANEPSLRLVWKDKPAIYAFGSAGSEDGPVDE